MFAFSWSYALLRLRVKFPAYSTDLNEMLELRIMYILRTTIAYIVEYFDCYF